MWETFLHMFNTMLTSHNHDGADLPTAMDPPLPQPQPQQQFSGTSAQTSASVPVKKKKGSSRCPAVDREFIASVLSGHGL